MQIIRTDKITEKTAVALGNFDGLHTAHREIIKKTCTYREKYGLLSCVLLFATHTDKSVSLLTELSEKLEILEAMGVDVVYIKEFTEEFMHKSPEEFGRFLKDTLNADAVCVGYDYRFGYKAEGDTEKLRALGGEYGFIVKVTDELKYKGEAIKSTRIRDCIANGDIAEANVMLGRRYAVAGEVVRGLQNGRKLGFPTANIAYADNKLLPKCGVYKGYTTVDGKTYKSVINVGNNPTFGADKITVESHILGFSGDIYGQTAIAEFQARLRDEKKFNSIDELKEQLKKDVYSMQ